MEDFVMAYRLEHGDYMCISKRVAEEYPSKFRIEDPPIDISYIEPEPELEVEKVEEKPVKLTRKSK